MRVVSAPRFVRWGAILVVIAVLGIVAAAENMPSAKVHDVTLRAPARVGDVVLAAGTYRVSHLMDNGQHIMLFKAVRGDKKEYRVSCKLRDLPAAAARDEQRFAELSGNERTLTSLVFAGDRVEHVF